MTSKTRTKTTARELATTLDVPYQTCLAAAAALGPLVARTDSEKVSAAVTSALRAAAPKTTPPPQAVTSEEVLAARPEPTGTLTCELELWEQSQLVDLLPADRDLDERAVFASGRPMVLRQHGDGASLLVPCMQLAGRLPGPGAAVYAELFLDEGAHPPVEHCIVTWEPILAALRAGAGADTVTLELPYWEVGAGHVDLRPPYTDADDGLLPAGDLLATVSDDAGWEWDVWDSSWVDHDEDALTVETPVTLPAGLLDWADEFDDGMGSEQGLYVGSTGIGRSRRKWWGAGCPNGMTVWVATTRA